MVRLPHLAARTFASISAAVLVAALAPMSALAEQTLGGVTDPIGVLRIAKGAPVTIGGYWVLSGPDTALGTDSMRGAKLAFADIGNKIQGHPINFVIEDDACSAEGGQTAATKLASIPNIAIVLGPACSSAATPAAPILWQAGIADVATAASAPSLTAPDRKPEYDGFLRTIPSDLGQGKADAAWIYNQLGAHSVVAVHDGSPYAQQLAAVMAKNFGELGGKVLSIEAVSPTDVDMHPVLTRIATERPDAIYMPIFVAAAAQMLRQSKDVPGLAKTPLIGGGSLMAPEFIHAAGRAVIGFNICYPDVSPDARGRDYPKLVDEYTKTFGEAPISGYHANAYDAAQIVIKAIEKVAKAGPDGALYIGRKALRDAAFQSAFEGDSGQIKCDEHGDCATFKPAVYTFVSDDPSTFKVGTNPKRIFP